MRRHAPVLAALLALVPAAPLVAQGYQSVDSIVERGIAQGIYPGAVVVVGTRDAIVHARGYGHLTWNRASAVPQPDRTLWDLASLTKVVATASSALVLVDRRRLDLDLPVNHYLPRFSGERKDEVTVRMLLDHTSGLPSYRQFFRMADDRDGAVDLLYLEPLQRTPGTKAVYSDLNAMLLGLVVEAVAGEPLDRFAARNVFAPLGMEDTRFRPGPSVRDRAAPTGRWRGHDVGGVVNDQNAVVLGGVAGHAGLFATGLDLARFAQWWLHQGRTAGGVVVQTESMTAFLTASANSGSRLLGWDTRDPEFPPPSVFGELLSPSAYGHTGWTGTEMWVDPERDLFLVFLTNRSYDPRIKGSIGALRRVRASLSEAVVRAVPGACPVTVTPTC